MEEPTPRTWAGLQTSWSRVGEWTALRSFKEDSPSTSLRQSTTRWASSAQVCGRTWCRAATARLQAAPRRGYDPASPADRAGSMPRVFHSLLLTRLDLKAAWTRNCD